MNSWYYSQADQAVGPFQTEVLGKLVHAGVISDATLVRKSGEEEWLPLATAFAAEGPVITAGSSPEEACYYYLDDADQPVGPLDARTMRRLHDEQVIQTNTLVSGIGDEQWLPAGRLLGLNDALLSSSSPPAEDKNNNSIHPRYLALERFMLMMGVTLTFYPVYLIPCQSRDLRAITGRERMEFTALLILGIVTLGVLLNGMLVLWAFDLEKHGKAVNRAGRQGSLGLQVLVFTALGYFLACTIDNFFLGCLAAAIFNGNAIWLLQKEINLYAAAPAPAAAL